MSKKLLEKMNDSGWKIKPNKELLETLDNIILFKEHEIIKLEMEIATVKNSKKIANRMLMENLK